MKKLSTIKRVCRMERYFDEVSNNSGFTRSLCRKRRILEKYMNSGLWLKDYQSDERGKIPKGIKRGVLSEDGLYNLLCDIEKGMHP